MKYTVAVCTLNEEENLPVLLESLDGEFLAEIVIVDGGSTDRTHEIASSDPRVRLEVCAGVGLLVQRLHSIRMVRTELVVIVDADDSLAHGSLDLAREELLGGRFAGVQFQMRSRSLDSWWEKGWDVNARLLYGTASTVPLLGRPCMTWTKYFSSVDIPEDAAARKEAGNAEDNYIHGHQVREFGRLPYAVSRATTGRRFPAGAHENLVKWWRYGKGDAAGIGSFRAFCAITYHQLGRCALARGVRSIKHTYGRHIPWFLLFGGMRFAGTLAVLVRRLFRAIGRRSLWGSPK